MQRGELKARPAGHEYRKELERRIGARAHLCEMSYLDINPQQRKPYEVKDGIALVEICGVLSNEACWWDETEYSEIRQEVEMAAEDSDVRGILLCINSPGGTTDNAFETAEVLQAAAKIKPMWAVADNIAYSAGFLMAVPAAKIYVPPMTGGVGSVGVYGAHFDYSKALEQAGVKVTLQSAGEGKTDGNPYEPYSEAAQKRDKAEIDRLYELFIGFVSTGRKKTPGYLKKLGAYCFMGAASAIEVGFADASGSIDQALADLSLATQSKTGPSMKATKSSSEALPASVSAAAIPKEAPKMAEPNVADINKPNPPEVVAPPTLVPTPASQAAAFPPAAGMTTEQMSDLNDLCIIAGNPAAMSGFLKRKDLTFQAAKAELMKARVDAAGPEIQSQVLPDAGTKPVTNSSSLKDACLKLAAQGKKAVA